MAIAYIWLTATGGDKRTCIKDRHVHYCMVAVPQFQITKLERLSTERCRCQHWKDDAGQHTSWKRLWIIFVPFTPFSSLRDMSHRRLQETLEAMLALRRCADPLADISRLEKSFLSSCSLLFSSVCVALTGSFKHKARTFVPSSASKILHCWTIEQLHTSSIATELNILVLNMSLSDDESLLRYFNFDSYSENLSRDTGPVKTNSNCSCEVELWHLDTCVRIAAVFCCNLDGCIWFAFHTPENIFLSTT